MLQWIEIGNTQYVCDQRPGAGPTSRPDRNSLFFRPANEVGDDQEVTGKTHVADDAQFVGQSLDVGRRKSRFLALSNILACDFPTQETLQCVLRLCPQVIVGRLAVRNGKRRQERLSQSQLEIASPCYLHGILERLRNVLKQRRPFPQHF